MIWQQLRSEAEKNLIGPLALWLKRSILDRSDLADSLSVMLSEKMSGLEISASDMASMLKACFDQKGISDAIVQDLLAIQNRDPAASGLLAPYLFFKGFHALQTYRAAHHLWLTGEPFLALFLQSQISRVFGVDIHPAAQIGRGILLDHATGVVIGETAVIEDNVSMLHEVTLGGTGKEHFDRHPKVRSGVLIGSGAKILGNIEIGTNAKVGAGSVVLHSVAPCTTVAGVPAKEVGRCKEAVPANEMNQNIEG